MNRIVREHYPASRLPEDLREGLAPDAEVRVTIDVAPAPEAGEADIARTGAFSRFKHLRRVNYASMDEVMEHVRALRDEWADRDR